MTETGILLHVWGEWACFTRPELKAERYSYEVMTPSAAIGILSAIYWKPEIRWHIDKIHVLKPIKLVSIRRNEVSAKATPPKSDVIKNGGEARLGLLVEETRNSPFPLNGGISQRPRLLHCLRTSKTGTWA